ncbi:MAG: TRAP transporter substrate-binding protein, partial [Bdellovibrionales bacterium]|nr:TRAP transporter substrate-binding protein [Bdellovibrionales bacterium]
MLSTLMLIAFSLPTLFTATAHGKNNAQFEIRWLLAHEPVRVFERAAKQFKKEVEKESGGKIAVEVMTASEYKNKHGVAPKYAKGSFIDDIALVKDGNIEMTQTYTTSLAQYNPTMWVLDLPFLFRDHSHAKKVMDGEIGQKIMAGLRSNNIRGLAFTYSGGYRVISSRGKGINKVDDFKSMTIRTANSPVAKATFERLGAKTVAMDHDRGIDEVRKGSLMAAETTFARYDEVQQKATPVLNDTQHSLFLTSMVVNEKFYASLPKDLQAIVLKAAKNAADTERIDSLSDEEELRKTFASKGMKIVAMPAAEVKKMREITRPLY